MPRLLAAASLAAALALSASSAFAENDMSGTAMPDKTMETAKPMAKPHATQKHAKKPAMKSEKTMGTGEKTM